MSHPEPAATSDSALVHAAHAGEPGEAAAAPSPTGGADARNRRSLILLAFIAGGTVLLLFAFFSVIFNRRPAVSQRAAQVRGAAPANSAILQRPVSTDVSGFTPARGGRTDASIPTPAARTSPAVEVAAPEFLPAPTIPAAYSATARRAGAVASGRSAAVRTAPIRGVVPGYQVIPCKLVGALENSGSGSRGGSGIGSGGTGSSSSEAGAGGQTSTIKALVDEDVRTWDTHEVIIPKGTQCNAVGRFQRGRDRVLVDTDWTFILPDRGPGHVPLELVLPGIAQDREYDAAVDSWSVTDLSDGIRGDYIQTRNFDELKVFAYKFLSGASGALSATSASAFGQSFANGSSSGASGLPGYVINPAVGGSQAVLDREAERIAAKIENDGYFLRVPAHKQFYVYVTRGFSMRDAKNSAEAHALRERHEDDRLRVRDERRARERAAEQGGGMNPADAAGFPGDAALASLLNPGALSANGLRKVPALPTPNSSAGTVLRGLRPSLTPSTGDTDPLPTP